MRRRPLRRRPTREWVELVSGEKFFSTDHWVTVWRQALVRPPHSRGRVKAVEITDKAEADRIRAIAVMAHGGGRDDRRER